jgi:Ca-activated chloride channel family protein
MKIRFHILFSLLFSVLFLANVQGQNNEEPEFTQPLTRILFVFDGSQSMFARWETGAKIDVAKRLMTDMLDSLNAIPNKNFQLALRIYGHQYKFPPQVCDDSRLEVAFGDDNIGKIKQEINNLIPSGTTPIAYSLQQAGYDFPPCGDCRNIIILITDGIEECDGDPCAVSRMLQERGVTLKPFVIGVGLDEQFIKTFECVGEYYDASNEQTFQRALDVVVSQALNNTTAQVNLLDIHGNPMETDVPMTFYNQVSGAILENFVHTINHRGNPDTLVLDPLVKYRMVVHTIPPVVVENIKLIPGTHNIIAADAPQGTLSLKINGIGKQEIPVIIRKAGYRQTLNVQMFNTTEEYLVGKYDLEILTLPRYLEYDIQVNQSTDTKIEVPTPGLVTLTTRSHGHGSIFVERGNELEWVVDLDDTKNRHTYNLQPGVYRVVFRPKNAKQTIFTVEKRFRVESGGSIIVNL